MSKRSGDFVTLREVVEEVGRDPIRFMMIFRKNDAPLDFDFEKVTEQSKDNPVFYVQYAHARTCFGVPPGRAARCRRSRATRRPSPAAPLERLTDSGEMALIRRLAEYPRVVEAAAAAHEPHRVAFYLHDLASEFHAHWNRGKELPQLRFINPADPDVTHGAACPHSRHKTGVVVGIDYAWSERTGRNALAADGPVDAGPSNLG